VAVAVVRVAPALDHAPVVEIGHRLDVIVDPRVDALKVFPGLGGEHDIARFERLDLAFARMLDAELDPADRRSSRGSERNEECALARRGCGRYDLHRGEARRQRCPDVELSLVAPSHPAAPSLLT